MKIEELYKLHINPNADIIELHFFYKIFNVNQIYIEIPTYYGKFITSNDNIKSATQLSIIESYKDARKFILKNSKNYKKMAEKLIDVLTRREKGDKDAAQHIFDEMVERVREGEDPEDVLYEEGLEPDYVMDLLIDE